MLLKKHNDGNAKSHDRDAKPIVAENDEFVVLSHDFVDGGNHILWPVNVQDGSRKLEILSWERLWAGGNFNGKGDIIWLFSVGKKKSLFTADEAGCGGPNLVRETPQARNVLKGTKLVRIQTKIGRPREKSEMMYNVHRRGVKNLEHDKFCAGVVGGLQKRHEEIEDEKRHGYLDFRFEGGFFFFHLVRSTARCRQGGVPFRAARCCTCGARETMRGPWRNNYARSLPRRHGPVNADISKAKTHGGYNLPICVFFSSWSF